MTWYRNGKRIGDDMELGQYMLDAVLGTNDDPDGDIWRYRFRHYMNDTYSAMEMLEMCEGGADYNSLFIDWIDDWAKCDTEFGEGYGFDWIEEE